MIIRINDFSWNGTQTLFVQVTVECENNSYQELLRIMDSAIYGDFVNENKSPLKHDEIRQLLDYLDKKIKTGFFEE